MSAGLSMWLQVAKSAAGAAGRHAGKVHSSHLLRWLASLGGLGIFAVSVFDSSMVPLPLPGSTDLLLLLLAAHRGATPVTASWLGKRGAKAGKWRLNATCLNGFWAG
jgi:hypothetical protein